MLVQSLHKSRAPLKTVSVSEDDEEVQIEAEFLTTNKPPAKVITAENSATATTTSTTTTSSSSKSICSPAITPATVATVPNQLHATAVRAIPATTAAAEVTAAVAIIAGTATKRGRPFKLNLAAVGSEESAPKIILSPSPPVVQKRPYSSITTPEISAGPLNLSKRPTLDPVTPLQLDLPPLLPIRHSHHYMDHRGRELLGSTGSGGELSSTETSPNVSDVYVDRSDFGNVFVDGVRLYEERNENARNDYLEEGSLLMSLERHRNEARSSSNILMPTTKSYQSPAVTITEKRGIESMVCQQRFYVFLIAASNEPH